MGIQFDSEIRVLVTTNTDSAGVVDGDNLTQDNTTELLISKGSLQFNQELSEQFIDTSNYYEPTNISTKALKTLPVGTGSFTTLFNTGTKGPFDYILWNSLVNDSGYPGNSWILNSGYNKLKLYRNSQNIKPFGVIIFTKDLYYTLNSCRITSCSISMSLDGLIYVTWNFDYLISSIVKGPEPASFAPDFPFAIWFLNGKPISATKTLYKNFNYSSGKFVKLGIASAGESTPRGYVASTGLSLDINNTINYVEDKGIDSTTLYPIYASTSEYAVSGAFTAYVREIGTQVNTLISNIKQEAASTDNRPLHKIFIEVFNGSIKLADIILDGVTITSTTDVGSVLSENFNFKLVNSEFTENCSIKFYA